MHRQAFLLAIVALFIVSLPVCAWAQDEARLDTSRVYELDAVVDGVGVGAQG